MKFNDSAWTEEEPGGYPDGLPPPDPRLIDKAYGAMPAGGYMVVGGTDRDDPLAPGRLPSGHAPSTPVSPTTAIDTAGGAPDVSAVLTLTGTFAVGGYVEFTWDASEDANPPTGLVYPIQNQDQDAASVAAGIAGYVSSVGVLSATSSGGTVTITPNAGESITISALSYVAPAALTPSVGKAGGTVGDPATIDLGTGTVYPGDTVEVDVEVDGGATVTLITYWKTTKSAVLAGDDVAGTLNAHPALVAENLNGAVGVEPQPPAAAINISAVRYVAAAGGGGGGPTPPGGGGGTTPPGTCPPEQTNAEKLEDVVADLADDGTLNDSAGRRQ